MKVIATNKKAYFDYFIISTLEAGIVLQGSEVKSVRAGFVNLKDSFVSINTKMEAILRNMYIKNYEHSTYDKLDEKCDRKLLVNKSQIKKLDLKVKEKGFTIVPLKIYFNDSNKVKIEIGLVKGKHTYDKKQNLALKDRERETQREIKTYFKKNKF